MTPDQISKNGTESGHQMAIIQYCLVAEKYGFFAADFWVETNRVPSRCEVIKPVPELHWFHAIQNGGSRGDDVKSRFIRGNKMKMEGVKNGVSDLSLPCRSKTELEYSGLYIEMKKPAAKAISKIAKGGLSILQKEKYIFVDC